MFNNVLIDLKRLKLDSWQASFRGRPLDLGHGRNAEEATGRLIYLFGKQGDGMTQVEMVPEPNSLEEAHERSFGAWDPPHDMQEGG